MSVAAVASRPEVGSSMNSRLGFATSSTPMLTLFLWPPLMPLLSTEPTSECCRPLLYVKVLSSHSKCRKDIRRASAFDITFVVESWVLPLCEKIIGAFVAT